MFSQTSRYESGELAPARRYAWPKSTAERQHRQRLGRQLLNLYLPPIDTSVTSIYSADIQNHQISFFDSNQKRQALAARSSTGTHHRRLLTQIIPYAQASRLTAQHYFSTLRRRRPTLASIEGRVELTGTTSGDGRTASQHK